MIFDKKRRGEDGIRMREQRDKNERKKRMVEESDDEKRRRPRRRGRGRVEQNHSRGRQ